METETIEEQLLKNNFCYFTDQIAFGIFVCKLCGFVFEGFSSAWIFPEHSNLPCKECGCNSAMPRTLVHDGLLED